MEAINEPNMPIPDLVDCNIEFVIPLSNNNSKYILNIELKNNKLNLYLKNIEEIVFSHKKSYSLEEIKQISNIFSFHKDLKDIYEYLVEMLNNKLLLLNLDNNSNNMYLSYTFEIPGTKKKEEVKLFFEKYISDINEENELIKKELIKLKKEVNELKEENQNLKNIIENKNTNTNTNTNTNNADNDIKDNLEEIINILIEEKLKNITNQINEIKNDVSNIKISTREEINNITSIIDNINNIDQEENQKFYKRLNEVNAKVLTNENEIENIKRIQQENMASFQTIINSNQEEIESLRLMVNESNNLYNSYRGVGGTNAQKNKKENDISKFIQLFKNNIDEYKNKNIQLKLIYDAGRDGRTVENCHSKCNNIQNTFSLVTTTKGNKFGFFRSIAINGNGDYLPDNKAFFISFDKNKIYKIKKDKNAVKFDNNTYINTANFNLIGNILSDKYTCPDKDSLNLNFEGFTEEYEITCGEKEFYVKKFEVYQLEFSD